MSEVGTVYYPDGRSQIVRPANGRAFEIEELQKYVEGYIELVTLRREYQRVGAALFVNEEGKIHNKEPNPNATQFADIAEDDIIAGTAILVREEGGTK